MLNQQSPGIFNKKTIIMTKTPYKVISVIYELRSGGSEGDVIEKVTEEKPAEFLLGAGKIIDEFENQVSELKESENFEFQIESEKAYGPVKEEAKVDLPMSAFQIDGKIPEDLLQPGKILPMKDQQGNPLYGRVVEVEDDKVKMDFNHPLAGMDLHFKGQVLSTRQPTEKEIENKQVEGEGEGEDSNEEDSGEATE